jgi:hypothetical protein
MQYNYIERVKNTGTEEDLNDRVEQLLKEYSDYTVCCPLKVSSWIYYGIQELKRHAEFMKYGRTGTGESIVKFKEMMKRYKVNVQQSLFNTEQRKK